MPALPQMNQDFLDLLRAFIAAEVRFLVVGAYALAAHGRPRATGDLDLWVEPQSENAARVLIALREFGAPAEALSAADLTTANVVFQIGLPPRRIDLLTTLTGLSFSEAWAEHVTLEFEGLLLPFIGRAAFIKNKRATGRVRDLADVEALGSEE